MISLITNLIFATTMAQAGKRVVIETCLKKLGPCQVTYVNRKESEETLQDFNGEKIFRVKEGFVASAYLPYDLKVTYAYRKSVSTDLFQTGERLDGIFKEKRGEALDSAMEKCESAQTDLSRYYPSCP